MTDTSPQALRALAEYHRRYGKESTEPVLLALADEKEAARDARRSALEEAAKVATSFAPANALDRVMVEAIEEHGRVIEAAIRALIDREPVSAMPDEYIESVRSVAADLVRIVTDEKPRPDLVKRCADFLLHCLTKGNLAPTPTEPTPVVPDDHDPTNPFAPRERPKRSIRLMTDAERRAAGLDPNGGFDGPTGAD